MLELVSQGFFVITTYHVSESLALHKKVYPMQICIKFTLKPTKKWNTNDQKASSHRSIFQKQLADFQAYVTANFIKQRADKKH